MKMDIERDDVSFVCNLLLIVCACVIRVVKALKQQQLILLQILQYMSHLVYIHLQQVWLKFYNSLLHLLTQTISICYMIDHYHWIHHSSGRMLPVGIAHPLKNDCENDSEPEELEEILKGPSSKGAMSLHRSDHGSSSKEDQSSDNNEEQNASSSDTADSSSSTSDENEDDDSQEVQMSLRETLKRANRDENVIDSKPKIVMKSPYKGEPISHSHSYSRSSKLIIICNNIHS